MRFDDTLATVMAADLSTSFGKASAWRQLVDLIGRNRAAADPRAIDLLRSIRRDVPLNVRAAAARALELASPPAALVHLCATDDIAVAAPVLRVARLSAGEWIELLPRLSAACRTVVRARRDLPHGVTAALATFTADFVIEQDGGVALQADNAAEAAIVDAPAEEGADVAPDVGTAQPAAQREDALPAPAPTTPSTFVSLGAAVLSIPLVAAAIERSEAADVDQTAAPPRSGTRGEPSAVASVAQDSGEAQGRAMEDADTALADRNDFAVDGLAELHAPLEGPFEIADVVARIDAFYTRQQDRPLPTVALERIEGFRFETDAQGIVRWVDGVVRGPLIGLSLELAAGAGGTGVDGTVSGAFRQRAIFHNARLIVAGASDAAGDWRISGTPAFDPETGRFAGYRGTARRPRLEDDAALAPARTASADSLRQLMHELRTPANAIAGFSEMIEREILGDVDPVYRERAATIRSHARALLAAIDDLDIAARIESSALRLQPGEVSLRPLLIRIVEDLNGLAEMRGATIVLPQTDASIATDARAVERLLSRLLATLLATAGEGERIAIEFSERDGQVMIAATRPRALQLYPSQALFAIDDEQEGGSLLGTGFALRLLRNLARELSGALVIEADRLMLELPATVTKSLEVMR